MWATTLKRPIGINIHLTSGYVYELVWNYSVDHSTDVA